MEKKEGYAGGFKHEIVNKVESKGKGMFPRHCVEGKIVKPAKAAVRSQTSDPKKSY